VPAAQRGSVVKRPTGWAARWYDEHGIRQFMPGFATKTAARDWLDSKVDEVEQLRRGVAVRPELRARDVNHLADTFLDGTAHRRPRHEAEAERAAAEAPPCSADRHPDSIVRIEWEDFRASLPAGSRHDVFRASRQCMTWGVDRQLVTHNGAPGSRTRSGSGTSAGRSCRSSRGPRSSVSAR
jgi:hypothetical protein